jgi:hypothetical protein
MRVNLHKRQRGWPLWLCQIFLETPSISPANVSFIEWNNLVVTTISHSSLVPDTLGLSPSPASDHNPPWEMAPLGLTTKNKLSWAHLLVLVASVPSQVLGFGLPWVTGKVGIVTFNSQRLPTFCLLTCWDYDRILIVIFFEEYRVVRMTSCSLMTRSGILSGWS